MSGASSGHQCVRLALRSGLEDEFLALADAAGFGTGAATRDYPHGLLADEPDPPQSEVQLRLWVPDPAFAALAPWLAGLRAAWSLAEADLRILAHEAAPLNADPEALWQSHWRPFRCAGFSIRASFHPAERLPVKPGDLPLVLAPGSAFGNGFHPTTRMALKAVRRLHAERSPELWLDVGAGSGILAVAAARLGTARVHGMDPEAHSALQARRMAQLNQVADRVSVWRGRLDSARGRYPAVVANLFADLLEDSAPAMAALVEPGGRLYAGGIVDRRSERTERLLLAAGLRLEGRLESGRWRGLFLRRPHP